MNPTHLERRRIEAGVMVPLVQAFEREFGSERARSVARTIIQDLAREDGKRGAQEFGCGLEALGRVAELWAAGGSLEIHTVERSATTLGFDVTRCRYAEYFPDPGLPELESLFHCSRDFAMIDGFDPRISLQRTSTIMEGADHCDFRFRLSGSRR